MNLRFIQINYSTVKGETIIRSLLTFEFEGDSLFEVQFNLILDYALTVYQQKSMMKQAGSIAELQSQHQLCKILNMISQIQPVHMSNYHVIH